MPIKTFIHRPGLLYAWRNSWLAPGDDVSVSPFEPLAESTDGERFWKPVGMLVNGWSQAGYYREMVCPQSFRAAFGVVPEPGELLVFEVRLAGRYEVDPKGKPNVPETKSGLVRYRLEEEG